MLISIKYQEIKHFPGSDKSRMLFFLFIKVEMPTNANNIYEQENNSCSVELSMKKFYSLGARIIPPTSRMTPNMYMSVSSIESTLR